MVEGARSAGSQAKAAGRPNQLVAFDAGCAGVLTRTGQTVVDCAGETRAIGCQLISRRAQATSIVLSASYTAGNIAGVASELVEGNTESAAAG